MNPAFMALTHWQRNLAANKHTKAAVGSRRKHRNWVKIALLLRQSRALLAGALLFVPPVVPSCCDVKAAIQSREKGNCGLSPHQ
ncbi:hypothetical protein AAY473_010781 [Plecturocebus cupreus]